LCKTAWQPAANNRFVLSDKEVCSMNIQSESILTPDGMTMLKNFLSI